MLLEFNIKNYKSFKDHVSLSLIAAKLGTTNHKLDADNVIVLNEKMNVLRSVLIYGANASGKSNLINAFNFMRNFIKDSAREQQAEDTINVEPFLLNINTENEPSSFEVVMLIENIQYRYGFEVKSDKVVAEWLYYVPTIREVKLFTRDESGIYIRPRFKEGSELIALTRSNALFLSVVAQFNGKISSTVRQWFVNGCRVLKTIKDTSYMPFTISCIEKGRYQKQIVEMVRRLDLGIKNLSVNEIQLPDEIANLYDRLSQLPEVNLNESNINRSEKTEKLSMKQIQTRHSVRDEQGKIIKENDFIMSDMESDGTQKAIALLGPLLHVLENGFVLFIDEIDARLHPLITNILLSLFNSNISNPKNAQLICATHDINLLNRDKFRRDQIYFTEKDQFESTQLYSLAEFKYKSSEKTNNNNRNYTSLGKDYIQGRYGAIPFLGDMNSLFLEERDSIIDQIDIIADSKESL